MKKLLLTFIGIVVLLSAHATDYETINGLTYLINTENKTATLVANNTVKYSGDIVVPEKVTLADIDYSVVAFADDCFFGCTSLTSITIPSSVMSLGDDCFLGCSSLTSIAIPSSVTSLGVRCFYGCSSLTSITIPSSVTSLGVGCFFYCTSLASITIPSSVTSLGNGCFFKCTSLTSIDIPSSVTSVGDECFSDCSSLTSITIPSSVASLGRRCFYWCTSLASITIPSSVTSLGEWCFYGCSSLTSITIPSSVASLGDDCFFGCTSLTSITIPSSVTSLGESCFSGCSSLASITIPESVTSLRNKCFEDCSSLKSISLPSSLIRIGQYSFFDDNQLDTVYCYANTPPRVVNYVDNDYYTSAEKGLGQNGNTILCVPLGCIEKYQQANYWQDFKEILPIKGQGEGSLGKCGKPTITYSNGKLHFESNTEGASYHYTLSCGDVTTDAYSENGEIGLNASYIITAYAIADDYSASDNATATLYWVNGNLETTNINAAKMRGVLASSQNGIVTVSGLGNGEMVSLYTVDGKKIGEATAVDGVASYAVGNIPIVIAKVGTSSIKIAVK